MDTTNSSEKPQRRFKHGQRPTEPLADWPTEFGAAGAEQPDATSGDAPDLQQLKALALAATPGPWTYFPKPKYNEHHVSIPMEGSGMRLALFDTGCQTERPEQDARFIAAANPAVVLDLIARIERAAAPAPTNATVNGGSVDGNVVYVSMDEKPTGRLWTVGARCFLAESSAAAPATASGDELPPHAGREALRLLAVMYDKYENGVQCYEDPEEGAGFMGTAVQLDSADECSCIELLNKYAPSDEVRAAVSAASTIGAAQTADQVRMAEIGHLIATQDNRITEAPIFVVEQKTPVVSDSDYNDCRVEWRETENGDYQLASSERAERLEALHRAGRDTPGWRRYEMTDIWTFVTACFTEQGCLDYLARNGHNLRETRVYAYGSYRNEEFRSIRNFLMSLRPTTTQNSEAGE